MPSSENSVARVMLLCVLLFLAISCRSTSPLSAFQTLRMNVDGVAEGLRQQGGPSLRITFTNISKRTVAFSETFRYNPRQWIGVTIRDAAGQDVPYPFEADLFQLPPFRCLSPGESITWTFRPLRWQPWYGGKIVASEGRTDSDFNQATT